MTKIVQTTTIKVTVPINDDGSDATWANALAEAKKVYPGDWLEYLGDSSSGGDITFEMRVGDPEMKEIPEPHGDFGIPGFDLTNEVLAGLTIRKS